MGAKVDATEALTLELGYLSDCILAGTTRLERRCQSRLRIAVCLEAAEQSLRIRGRIVAV